MVNSVDLFATLLDYAGLGHEETNDNSPSRSIAPLLRGEKFAWDNAVFMEQEETRAIRTDKWLYMKRFRGSDRYPFEDELYDLVNDPAERENVAGEASVAEIASELSARIDIFFQQYAFIKYII